MQSFSAWVAAQGWQQCFGYSLRRCLAVCLVCLLSLSACGGGGGDGYGGGSGAQADQNPVGGGSAAPPGTDDEAGDTAGDEAGDGADAPGAGGTGGAADPGPEDPVSDDPEPPPAPPVANAGFDTGVSERSIVYLDAGTNELSASEPLSYRWDQLAGPPVALDDPLSARASFTAPSVLGSESLQFQLTVTDAAGVAVTDSVEITVRDAQDVPDDPDEFLTWLDDLSALYAGNAAGAEAYYRAIDPLDEKTNLEDWRAANDFDAGADASAVYRNAADLGFGRVMSMRTRGDGSVAAYVENYATLEEAVEAMRTGVRAGLLATVAMEYSPGPSGGAPYTKFYTFGPDDERITSIDLDGRGAKFMPGLCNVCHGGQPQPLVAGEFPQEGNTNAQFLPWDLETYEFSSLSGFTRADQEAALKALNLGALSTYPAVPRPGHWSGRAARELIEGWYGGPALARETADPAFVPEGWRDSDNGGPPGNPPGVEELYLDVIAPNCRACHVTRGRYYSDYAEGELIDFSSYENFMRFEDDLVDLLFGTGTMPDALVTFEQFWSNHDGVIGAERLAAYLGIDATELRPGLPVADPGPDRDVPLGTVALNGQASSFAETFQWSFAPGGRPSGSSATINGANSATATLDADVPGVYVVQLVVGNDAELSEPETVRLVALFGTDPIRFNADIAPIIARSCANCHSAGRAQSVEGIPVLFDEPLSLYERLRRYVNVNDFAASPLLSKPAGTRHGGATVSGFDLSGTAGSNRDDYDLLLQWIGEGAGNN